MAFYLVSLTAQRCERCGSYLAPKSSLFQFPPISNRSIGQVLCFDVGTISSLEYRVNRRQRVGTVKAKVKSVAFHLVSYLNRSQVIRVVNSDNASDHFCQPVTLGENIVQVIFQRASLSIWKHSQRSPDKISDRLSLSLNPILLRPQFPKFSQMVVDYFAILIHMNASQEPILHA